MASTGEVIVPFFKKGKSRPTTSRLRATSPPPAPLNVPVSSSSKSEVVLPSRKANGNLLSAGTKRTSSQRHEIDDQDVPEREGPDIKWTASGSHVNAALDILAGDEAAELLAKRQRKEKAEKGDEDEDIPDDGLYRGQKAYRSHIKKNQEVPKAMRVGPQRSTNTIRTVTIVDYQPDVCKDYKETGYCGFGDTCKFLHDRGTYLAGWQLDNLAANPKKNVEDVSDSDSDDEDIPFACLICRKHYTEPIVTRCGHYFCSACAIKRFAKTPKCLACGAPTGGIFNRADKVMDKINKKRKEKEEEEGEDAGNAGADVKIEGLIEQGSDAEGDSDESDDSANGDQD
ncbi:hypothetical protein SERLA73DRAFT_180881 [Serpula lacrymans var. lacrymans S7.3]|uniref:Pre-mRNA-splicing factor CWC24 n=2 Tax=Serpula lacrymans var. lacrymans TaxID=341189 RepID=F8PWL2_SERL3|nr:uncharacterized protein SERLADRAFT_466683 [Serpula lacrymans var. lacrymans S7.9]EGO00336.1 hypothetical protein SERLA73DRAFT_180881 [Serpula lacrymans var. lacrymans S7.3]EGO25896.1 hypothetical protein SERLADRAFT_466683 [Serpula lacrymans var. lacrymans S7.9]